MGLAAAACVLTLGALAGPAHAAPRAGNYDAQLCVSTAAAAPSCGPARVELHGNGLARVHVSDLVYRLQLRSSQVEVVLTHGAMQIDEFTAVYEWAGTSLQFVDADKNARYELRLGERKVAK
jgi:plasmid stabilization system protein ParE